MACYLAKAGLSCAVFEREIFERPHVGESLVPSSTRVFKDPGFLEQMEAHKFPPKYGAVWTAAGNPNLYQHDWEGLSADQFAAIRFEERDSWVWQIPITAFFWTCVARAITATL
jgi:FADH2 O2-dependent halogenase